MSDILIKGMEMPKSCDGCRIMVFEDTNCVPELYCGCPIVFKAHPQGVDHRPDYCPLVPAADVRPVVRGKWVEALGCWCTPGGDPVWECSECGKGRHVYGIEHGSYGAGVADGQWVACPNCGADMRPPKEET